MSESVQINTYWKHANTESTIINSISRNVRTLVVSVYDIGMTSVQFAEKWLLVPGRHYRIYVNSSPPSTSGTGNQIFNHYIEQLDKSYAGDVTGVLGEAFSVLALTREFDIDEDQIAHLRPEKYGKKCPDFIIYRNSPDILDGFENAYRTSNGTINHYNPPDVIPMESKGSVNGKIGPAVSRAIAQLIKFWDYEDVNSRNRYGLISFMSLANSSPELSLIYVVPREI